MRAEQRTSQGREKKDKILLKSAGQRPLRCDKRESLGFLLYAAHRGPLYALRSLRLYASEIYGE